MTPLESLGDVQALVLGTQLVKACAALGQRDRLDRLGGAFNSVFEACNYENVRLKQKILCCSHCLQGLT